MENLRYISTEIRQRILEVYCKEHNMQCNMSELESKIFGYPAVRRMVDAGMDEADHQVDIERYHQHDDQWCDEVVRHLPEPEHLDDYAHWTDAECLSDTDINKIVEETKNNYEKICRILIEFNFDKVRKVMEALDWNWATWEDEYDVSHHMEIPSTYALRCQAYKLLKDALKDKTTVCTGGFEASYEDGDLSLKFVVESFESLEYV